MKTLTAALLREVMDYDPETGVLRWRQRALHHFATARACSFWNTRYAGKAAGSIDAEGRVHVALFGRDYLGHRLAWLHFYGRWPHPNPDHRNCNPADNRIANLREATKSQNGSNRGKQRNNKSGFKGVSWSKHRSRWVAFIELHGRSRYLGLFDTPEAAHAAYSAAAMKLHGEFARVDAELGARI